MYIPGFGSASTALHLIAKYPVGAVAIGAVSLFTYLSPPLGVDESAVKNQTPKKVEVVVTK